MATNNEGELGGSEGEAKVEQPASAVSNEGQEQDSQGKTQDATEQSTETGENKQESERRRASDKATFLEGTDFDPTNLEGKDADAYKGMQSHFTKTQQELKQEMAELKSERERFDKFKGVAKKYGYQDFGKFVEDLENLAVSQQPPTQTAAPAGVDMSALEQTNKKILDELKQERAERQTEKQQTVIENDRNDFNAWLNRPENGKYKNRQIAQMIWLQSQVSGNEQKQFKEIAKQYVDPILEHGAKVALGTAEKFNQSNTEATSGQRPQASGPLDKVEGMRGKLQRGDDDAFYSALKELNLGPKEE
jgi:hypothetical protein